MSQPQKAIFEGISDYSILTKKKLCTEVWLFFGYKVLNVKTKNVSQCKKYILKLLGMKHLKCSNLKFTK